MNQKNYQLAAETFRRAISSGPLEATLMATAIACDEARGALRWAGHQDDQLMKDLGTIKARLEAALSAGN